MKTAFNRSFPRKAFLASLLFFALACTFAFEASAQTRELSLADLVIALRSQKVTLPERNRILTDAVKERGVTFAYTNEIAKELEATGASPELLAAVKEMGTPKPAATPTPPDHTFYQRRAAENAVKGEYKLALADYDKAAEMKSDDVTIFLGRGRTHFNLRSYDLSVADFNRAIELSPNDSSAYFNRGVSHEKMGEIAKAVADYTKAVELDEKNDTAQANLKRLQDEIAQIEAQKVAAEKAAAEERARQEAAERAKAEEAKAQAEVVPEYINAGTLTASNAIKMAVPVYPQIAARSRIEGRVTVEVTIDENGEVTSADATNGPQMLRGAAEDAARRSKFTPFNYNGKPVKAKGNIVYNFSLRGTTEE